MDFNQKILIVDDRPENLLVLERLLRDIGAMVIQADSGNEALKASLRHDFALAILDVQMPDMDGYELAEFLRSVEKTRRLPIIFLSAVYSDQYHLFRGYEAGGVDFITKPYKPEILLAKVQVFLELDRQKRELLDKVALEQAKNYLEDILLSMVDAVIVVFDDGIVRTVNDALLSLSGYEQQEVIGSPLDHLFEEAIFANWIQKDVINSRPIAISASAPSRPVLYQREVQLRTRKNRFIPVQLSASALQLKDARPGGAVIVARDLTAAKQEEQNRIMTEKMTALGMMAGGVAHELNNPMMGLQVFIEYCLKHTQQTDVRYNVLSDAIREVKRCIDLVQNMLTFSHIRQPEQEPFTEVPAGEPMERVLRLLAYRIEKENVRVERKIAADCPQLRVKVNALQQVLLNLTTNALDAMAATGDRQLYFEIRPEEGRMRLLLSDTGTGIAAEHFNRIFDPFFTTKPPGKGTGLGLSVSQSIVASLGGVLRCRSATGAGTTFEILLPMV